MTRRDMIAAINAHHSAALRSEIDHQMTVGGRDYLYDEVCALLDTEDRAEGWGDRALLNDARDCLIRIGFYRVMPQAEIDSTWVSSGTKWAFKKGGFAYTTDHNSTEWFDAVSA